jgi:Zn-finger nucleic acid-binding protein
MLNCPNDGSELTPVTIEDIPVDQCPACGGFWLDRGELETLGEKHGAHMRPVTLGDISVVDETRQCPRDRSALHKHDFAEHTGFYIEQCPTCQGVWLEMDQLTAILGYLDKDGAYTEPTLSEQVMLFLYQLTARPPLV